MGSYSQEEIDLSDLTTWLLPVTQVHNGTPYIQLDLDPTLIKTTDQSSIAVLNRVIRQLPEDAEFLLKGRVRVIK